MTDRQFRDYVRKVAIEVYGETGRWLHDKADEINGRLFGGKLPPVWIGIEILPYGRCIGLASFGQDRRPVIRLAKETIFRSQRIPHGGKPFASDVLIHEYTHVSVQGLGMGTGTSSHNNDGWVAEVNRISPLIGLEHIKAGRAKSVRTVVDRDEEGRPVYKVSRMTPDDCISLEDLSRWPQSCRPISFYQD